MEPLDNYKTRPFQENKKLSGLLAELSGFLKPLQQDKEKQFTRNQWPLGFVVGNPRSGTTLITQWLASLGIFSYPSNFLTRFAYAPYIGALIQKMLFDESYDFHGDFADIQSQINFNSDLGKSKGALAVNEFQHFFRNYMPTTEARPLSDEELKRVDFQGMQKALASIEAAFRQPFITKVAVLKYNIKSLAQALPHSIFVHVNRHPLYVMQSLHTARIRYFGDISKWYGSKPQAYQELKNMDVYHQVAGQVYYTEKELKAQLEDIPGHRKLEISYEEFCHSPGSYFVKLIEKYARNGCTIASAYAGPEQFELKNTEKLHAKEIDKYKAAYTYFSNQSL